MKKKILLLVTMAGLIQLTGCNKEPVIVNTHDDAYADVLLKKMQISGNIKYLPIYFAGGEDIEECTVTRPTGEVDTLHFFWAGPGIMTGKGPMKDVFDFPGEYTFHLKFADGYEKEITDVLEDVEIPLPQITVNYLKEEQKIEVSWTPVEGADLYCIKLTELDMANTKPLFKMPQLPTDMTSFTINIDGGRGWLRPTSDLQEGTEYWVVVAAKKVEEGAEVSGTSHDFQTSSCNKTKIVY